MINQLPSKVCSIANATGAFVTAESIKLPKKCSAPFSESRLSSVFSSSLERPAFLIMSSKCSKVLECTLIVTAFTWLPMLSWSIWSAPSAVIFIELILYVPLPLRDGTNPPSINPVAVKYWRLLDSSSSPYFSRKYSNFSVLIDDPKFSKRCCSNSICKSLFNIKNSFDLFGFFNCITSLIVWEQWESMLSVMVKKPTLILGDAL